MREQDEAIIIRHQPRTQGWLPRPVLEPDLRFLNTFNKETSLKWLEESGN